MSTTKYELINKNTGEVIETGFGPNGVAGEVSEGSLTVYLTDGTSVPFTVTDAAEGGKVHFNEMYDIRETITHTEPDGVGTVEVATSPEGEVEITHSDESAPETAGEAETVAEVTE